MNSDEGGGIETCARLMIGSPPSPLFIKGAWFPQSFLLSISDGLHCWTCHATEQEVAERAAGWDESITEYLQRTQFYLSHQHPASSYTFFADGENRKLSWTMEKYGTKLEGKWKCKKAKEDQQITCSILNFLMDSNVKLSDEVLRKTQSFERMKGEAERCLKLSEQFKNEKQQFEAVIFKKFVAVLNSKKSKLRELRDKLARFEPAIGAGEDGGGEEETDDDENDAEESSSGDEGREGTRHPTNAGEIPREMNVAMAEDVSDTEPDTHKSTSIMRSPARGQEADVCTNQAQKSPPAASSSAFVDSAAALLADSAYTSAPKRRRNL